MVRLHDNIHTVSVTVVNTMRERLVLRSSWLALVAVVALLHLGLFKRGPATVAALLEVAGFEVERVATVKIAVDWVTNISSVDGRGEVVVQAEAVDAFSQTVKVVVFRQAVHKLDKLVLINEMRALSSEDDISSRATADIEPERWLVAPLKPR